MNHKNLNNNSLEKQVEKIINFMKSHKWTGPIGIPLNLHEKLDKFTEKYLFDAYIDMNNAYKFHLAGNSVEAKKSLGYSLLWKDEALECSFHFGKNDFTTLIFKKTDEIINNVIQYICSDDISSNNYNINEIENIKENLKHMVEVA